MSVVKPDNSRKLLTTVVILLLSSLACTQAVLTPTPIPLSPTVPPSTATAEPTATAAVAETEDVRQIAVVKAAMVNIRSEPGGEVIGQVVAGQDVTVLGCANNWCEIEVDELTGYIFEGCLSISEGKGCEAK